MAEQITVTVDGMDWTTSGEFREYDAIHATAGALLAGADHVDIQRDEGDDGD